MQQDAEWDIAALRRSMRLLGAHSTHVANVQSTARALRLVWDMLQRRGIPTELFQLPGLMPLMIAGRGPVLVNTFIDDSSPLASAESNEPPTIVDEMARGPGVTRKAGVLGTLGAFLRQPSIANEATLVIEADRHAGSAALEAWLQTTAPSRPVAVYEVADLPVVAPMLYTAATGVIQLDISIERDPSAVEQLYGGVLPDVGHQLVEAVSALKSRDAEVLIPGFYDDVSPPDAAGMVALNDVASSVGAWIARYASPTHDLLNASHLTLGVFCAPALLVRELEMAPAGPYLSRSARATIELRVMPGQHTDALIASIRSFVTDRVPDARVEPLLVRRATAGWTGALPDLGVATLPVSPGDSPAGLFDAAGIPTLGYATVHRDPSAVEESASLRAVLDASTFVTSIITSLSVQTAHRRTTAR